MVDMLCNDQLTSNIFSVLESCAGRKYLNYTSLMVLNGARLITVKYCGKQVAYESHTVGTGDNVQCLHGSSSLNSWLIEPGNSELETVTVFGAWYIVGYYSTELLAVCTKGTTSERDGYYCFANPAKDYLQHTKLNSSLRKALALCEGVLKNAFHVEKSSLYFKR